MDPNDIIDTIVDAIDYAELTKDPQGLVKARRLLNNDLRQTIDQYIQAEVEKASLRVPTRKSHSKHGTQPVYPSDRSRPVDGKNFKAI